MLHRFRHPPSHAVFAVATVAARLAVARAVAMPCGGIAAQDASEPAPPPRALPPIAGRVLDAGGAPAAGARVVLPWLGRHGRDGRVEGAGASVRRARR